jgi:hypothetical protein
VLRAFSLLVAAILVFTVGASGAASEVTRVEAEPPASFSILRVCAYPAFSLARKRCTRDQRAATLVSSKFACSATIRVGIPHRLHAWMTYEGTVVHQFTTRALSRGLWDLWISENVGSTPLPGGRWTCGFSFGSVHTGASFRSGGATGPITGAAVCDARHSLFYAHHRIRVCKRDESLRPIHATPRILCSAVFVKQAGKTGEAQLLSGGTDAATPDVEEIPSPLGIWWTAFAPAAPAADRTFAAGDYVCRFSLNGRTVVEKPFQIIPG